MENVEAGFRALSLEGDTATVQACVSWPVLVVLCCLGECVHVSV